MWCELVYISLYRHLDVLNVTQRTFSGRIGAGGTDGGEGGHLEEMEGVG